MADAMEDMKDKAKKAKNKAYEMKGRADQKMKDMQNESEDYTTDDNV